MLRIRLRKPGRSVKRRYQFKIVVMDARRARDSKFIDNVGYYDPTRDILEFNVDKYNSWIKKGAQPTETVASLFKRYKRKVRG
jgi:small subunit ribosomal protein S16